MAKTAKSSESGKVVVIARDLRIAGAAATYKSLHALAQAADKRVSLDARQVDRVDAAGLQALLAGRRALETAGKTVTWKGCSTQLSAAAGLLGLAEALGLS